MSIIKTSSAKGKGRRLQQYIRDKLYDKYEILEDGDIESIGMGQQGCDVVLSPSAKRFIPFDIEAKNQEKLNIWSALEQAERNSKRPRIPLVVFKRNRSEVYACLKFEDLLDLTYRLYGKHLIGEHNELRNKGENYE